MINQVTKMTEKKYLLMGEYIISCVTISMLMAYHIVFIC